MSILINLLPDIRQQKLRERRRRQLVSGVSVLVWAVCGGIVVLLTVVAAGQKVAIKAYSDDINKQKNKLEQVSGLMDALTAQQHLASLPSLYQKRVYLTKFFKEYSASDPTEVTISTMALDADNLLTVNGVGKSYAAVAKLARALEASNVKVGTDPAEGNAPYFTDVNITTVAQVNNGVSFTLKASVDSKVSDGN